MNARKRINNGFLSYFQLQIERKRCHDRIKTAVNYKAVYRSFSTYLDVIKRKNEIDISEMKRSMIEDYESYLLYNRKISRNSSSFYLRILKAVYNRATFEFGINLPNPFVGVYCGVDKTVKRAVDINVIKRLANFTPRSKAEAFSRDTFLFCFMTRGMAFIDFAKLKPSNIIDGRIIYRRSKTGRLMSVKLETPMRCIIARYRHVGNGYLFPVVTSNRFDYSEYGKALQLYNYHLRRISSFLELKPALTSYVARHSWATEAMKSQVPIRIISESMGHADEHVTSIYLASIENKEIDSANMKVLGKLRPSLK